MSSPMRLSGLASGLDTDTIVKDLMKAERAPVNKLYKKKQQEEWKRDDYREMNTLMASLRDTVSSLRLQSTFLKKKVTSDNDTKIAAKTVGTPSASAYLIEVGPSLAAPAIPASVKFTHAMSVPNDSTKFSDVGGFTPFSFTVGNGTDQATINVDATDTIKSVIDKINGTSFTTGVKANYVADDRSITLVSTTASAASKIVVGGSPPGGNILGVSAGTVSSAVNDFGLAGMRGLDVSPVTVWINGIEHSFNSNTFKYDGVEYTVKEPSPPSPNPPVYATVSVKTDEDAIYDSIKGFVDKYNEVIDKLNTKISEKKYRDFQPLIKEEKDAMKDKDIENWEAKAKSGMLYHDPIISESLNQMRLSLLSPGKWSGVNNKFDTLDEIGITAGEYDENNKTSGYKEKGKLHISEEKLRGAISSNPQEVMDLFTKSSTSTDATTKFNESGLADRLYTQLNNSIKDISEQAGSSTTFTNTDDSYLGKSISRIQSDIDKWEVRLKDKENRYWNKFSAMEKAMSKMNSQSQWLAGQFGGGGSAK